MQRTRNLVGRPVVFSVVLFAAFGAANCATEDHGLFESSGLGGLAEQPLGGSTAWDLDAGSALGGASGAPLGVGGTRITPASGGQVIGYGGQAVGQGGQVVGQGGQVVGQGGTDLGSGGQAGGVGGSDPASGGTDPGGASGTPGVGGRTIVGVGGSSGASGASGSPRGGPAR